jgi:hypothetical protein
MNTTKSIACLIGRHHWPPQPNGQMFRTCSGCGHRQYGWYGVRGRGVRGGRASGGSDGGDSGDPGAFDAGRHGGWLWDGDGGDSGGPDGGDDGGAGDGGGDC